MIIALFPNLKKKRAVNLALGIREFLTGRGVQVVCPDETATRLNIDPLSSVKPEEVDFMVSMGGDGTILRLIHRHPDILAPVVGINLGNLGFMADVPISDIYPSFQDLLNGHFSVEERVMMEGHTVAGDRCFAVNEMVIHRAANPSLVDLAMHVDGAYLNTFSADGVIIATPSGSTAYSLAAGGPILTPKLEAFVITPISPHTVSNRPIVLMPEQEIQVQYLSENEPVEISFDGISRYAMGTGEVFRIQKAERTFNLVTLLRHDYFSILRKKLGWSGKLRA